MPTKLEQNRSLAYKLGWQPRDFGAPVNDFTSSLVAAIEHVQATVGDLKIDGIAGPKTYAQLLRARQVELLAHPGQDLERLKNAGVVALYDLKIHWMTNGGVVDLPAPKDPLYAQSQRFIDAAIRTPVGIDWHWESPYRANGDYEWCGAAHAVGWRKAGLKHDLAQDYFSSNYRLDRFARYQTHDGKTPNPKPKTGPYRMIVELDEHAAAQTPLAWQVGDCLTVGPAKSGYGKHICMIEDRAPDGDFITLEGNGTGLGPDGNGRHGIVRAKRPVGLRAGMKPTVYHARRLIRVAPSDLQ